ncbi:hypothetical protein INT47_010156 [Mucor saturninus]|uniref:Rieske domain-containing protein n=1 Tax=Mucor saturninus TaxID=64648 RepID=A0A8H7V5Z8_9FUNG|nr:hypothetical protein INT47_010156 [Mucor saturninus]
MFEPTIKYRRVNDPPKDITQALGKLDIKDEQKDNVKSPGKEQDKVKQPAKEPTVIRKEPEEPIKVENPAKTQEVVQVQEPTKEEVAKPESIKTEPVKVSTVPDYSFEEEEEDSQIVVDPSDKERIIVTLSTGKQFTADRYCPHAGADLSYHGKVSEHDYPPEIGPVLMCPIHYWEFALEKGGKGGGGWATINACEVKCPPSPTLDW